MVNKKNSNGSFIASALITIFIVAMLIISGPASAVIVSIIGLDGASITQGNSKAFNITVTLENPDTYVPISNVSINITGGTSINATFNPISGILTFGDNRISMATPIISPSNYYGGPGNGFGYDNYSGYGNGYGYDFGNGYGYGYNSGAGGGNVTFTYQVTLTTTSMATGSYSAIAHLNVNSSSKPYFASSTASFTIAAAPTSSSGSSGGGGGGGGGGGSSENYSNILIKEKYELHIFKDKSTYFRFTNTSNPVFYVNITGNTNSGAISVSVEVLKATSTLVKTAPPGTVFKNLNIWVGTSGFAVPKNIKTSLIGFKVDNSWIKNNGLSGSDVKLVKWDGSQWVQLETKEMGKSGEFIIFEGTTNSFSPFAIVGKVPVTMPGETTQTSKPTPAQTAPTAVPTEPKEQPSSGLGTYIFIAIGIILVVIIAIQLNLLKKKKERQNKKE